MGCMLMPTRLRVTSNAFRAALLLATIVVLGASGGARAQAAPAPAASTSKVIVLKAARMFDARTSRIVTPGVVVVRDARIVSVGAVPPQPDGATVIDLGDMTLLPGFIDAHVHLTGEAGTDWK